MSLDLNDFKEQIQSIFQTANTTTAATDLSTGLGTRVQRIMKINPARIPIQASLYPCVTIYIESKSIEMATIAINQTNAKRRADIDFKIGGIVWNSTNNDPEVDPSDDDCESLMENIEQIMRSNPTIAGLATWSYPTNVTYHALRVDEETHLRAGLMNYRATVFY